MLVSRGVLNTWRCHESGTVPAGGSSRGQEDDENTDFGGEMMEEADVNSMTVPASVPGVRTRPARYQGL